MNAPFAPPHLERFKLTVDDFMLLADAGVFQHNTRTELIDGEIYVVNATHRPHSVAHTRLVHRLAGKLEMLAIGLEALIAPSVELDDRNAPEPDIVITSEPLGLRMVPVESVRLVVEVAHSTADYDLAEKMRLYARNNIPEYWVVDLDSRQIHILWVPTSTGYAEHAVAELGARLSARTIAGLVVESAGLG